jgi:hypothetical protein
VAKLVKAVQVSLEAEAKDDMVVTDIQTLWPRAVVHLVALETTMAEQAAVEFV